MASAYVPAEQAAHAEVPVRRLLKAPTAQAAQADAPPSAANLPAPQAVHADVPVARPLYVPAAHAAHTEGVLAPVALP